MTLHTGTNTAGKVFVLVLVFVLDTAANRHHVADAAVVWILGGKNVVEQGALVEVRVAYVGFDGEQSAGHLDHVVDVAGFGGASINHVIQLVWRTEILVFAVASRGKAVVQRNLIPEKCRGFVIRFITRINVPLE